MQNNFEPSVSVVMSVYKEPLDWLTQSVTSILNQSFSDFEFLIINDNPDNAALGEFLLQYSSLDKRIKIIDNKINIGLTKSLNIGLRHAKGRYIARMDADDISLDSRLKIQVEFMDSNPECVVAGSYYVTLNDQKIQTFPTDNKLIQKFLLMDNCIPHPAAIIRRSKLIDNEIYYNENYRYSQDYGLWCELSRYGQLRNVPIPLLQYRISNGQISTKNRGEQKKIVAAIRRNYLKAFVENLNINAGSPENQNFVKIIKHAKIERDTKKRVLQSYYLSYSPSIYAFLMSVVKYGLFDLLLDKTYLYMLVRNSK
jgi:glycosyltransferase involved in cell wall biosynthesis